VSIKNLYLTLASYDMSEGEVRLALPEAEVPIEAPLR
jgi:hypothetical protein